jgi:hypothetical protein
VSCSPALQTYLKIYFNCVVWTVKMSPPPLLFTLI